MQIKRAEARRSSAAAVASSFFCTAKSRRRTPINERNCCCATSTMRGGANEAQRPLVLYEMPTARCQFEFERARALARLTPQAAARDSDKTKFVATRARARQLQRGESKLQAQNDKRRQLSGERERRNKWSRAHHRRRRCLFVRKTRAQRRSIIFTRARAFAVEKPRQTRNVARGSKVARVTIHFADQIRK